MFDPGVTVLAARRLAATVTELCATLDPDSVPTPEVGRLYGHLAAISRHIDGALTLLARRVEDSGAWRRGGDRSCAEFLARTTGTATARLTTSKLLPALPRTEAALRAGNLSAEQASTVADAATANPAAEPRLLDTAKLAPLGQLRDEARRAKAAADPDPEVTHARIHNERYLRRWTDGDGAYNLALRATAAYGAAIDAALAPAIDQHFNAARTAGRAETSDAYAADALHHLLTGDAADAAGSKRASRARESKVIALISHDALVRGTVADGETCELAGVGPVPVATVRAMLADAFLAAVVTHGVDVHNVAHLGRQPTAHQRTALETRRYHCEVPACPARHNLQIDHTDDWAHTKPTKLTELAWLCPHHHHMKTTKRYQLEGPAGHRRWLDPDGTVIAADHPDRPPEPELLGPPTAAG